MFLRIFYALFTLFTPFLLLFSFPMNCPVFLHFLRPFYGFYAFSFPFFLSTESVQNVFTGFLRTFYAFYAFSSPFFLSNETVKLLFTHFLRTFYAFLRPFLSFADVTIADVAPERSQKEERVRRCDSGGETGAKRLWHHYRYVGGERVPTAGMQSWEIYICQLRCFASSIQHFLIMRMEFGSKDPEGIRPTCRMLRIDGS